MSTEPRKPREQFVTQPSVETLEGLEVQRVALGYHTANSLATIYLNEMSRVPPSKVWEVLAKIRAYHKTEYKGGKRA